MKSVRGAIAVALIICALMLQINADSFDQWVLDSTNQESQDNYSLLGIQSEERWLIVPVSFDNDQITDEEVRELLQGPNSAEDYIDAISAGKSTLQIDIQPVWESSKNVKFWGEDVNGERDFGSKGKGVEDLISQLSIDILVNKDLTPWDLNSDGVIDRLLILHSATPQEAGGSTDSLWSHFSLMNEDIQIGDWKIEHYTIASINSGVGTIVHEMLHQMGALDLYDVHSDLPTSNWNGIGDWGLMASGNWNNNGNTPAMPSASTMEVIGLSRFIDVDYKNNTSFSITGISSGGDSLRVNIAPNEWIWFTFRDNVGFDSYLPGYGVLIEHQNRNNGDENDNLVNTDPKKAWVRIIEADGDAALERGRDSGSSGDVFTEGMKVGAEGMIIRDSHGRLVPWVSTITEYNSSENLISISFSPVSYISEAIVLPSAGPLEVLEGESLSALVITEKNCNLEIGIYSSLSTQNSNRTIQLDSGEHTIELLSESDLENNAGYLRGTVGCQGGGYWDIDLDWYKIGHRLHTDELNGVIPWDNPSSLYLYPECTGNSSRDYNIVIDGALSRISTVVSQGELLACPEILLEIDPNNLLSPGMIARGELVLVDTFGIEQRIPVELKAESSFTGDGPISLLTEPSNGISLILVLLSISFIFGDSKVEELKPENED
tara:strand:+ start:61485 stop:63470 length:1986 start_codon:yes stop_codon:yes gene_type:complete